MVKSCLLYHYFLRIHIADTSILFRVASLAIGQSYDCLEAGEIAVQVTDEIDFYRCTATHNKASPDLNLTPLAAFLRFCGAQHCARQKRKKAARGVRFKWLATKHDSLNLLCISSMTSVGLFWVKFFSPWLLTHCSWVRHICISKLTIIGSDSGLPLVDTKPLPEPMLEYC